MFKHTVTLIALAAALGTASAFCQEGTLPAPQKSGGAPLLDALQKRQSAREFLDRALTSETLSSLLWAANGISRPDGKRTAPTALNCQDTDVYVVTKDGGFLYAAAANALVRVATGDLRALAGKQDYAKTAPVNLIYVHDRAKAKGTGAEEIALFAGIHAGAVSQNVYLFCASEGLATVVRRSIDFPALHSALKLRPDQVIVLGQTVGYPVPAKHGSAVSEAASDLSAPLDERWPLEKAQAWQKQNGWLRGSNFTPSTASNQLEMWQEETFDPKTIDRELGYAQDLGFNCMRVFLHHAAWESDKEGFKKRIKHYLDISSKRGIKTVFVFFDDCWNAEFKTGKQPEPIPGAHNSRWLRDPGDLLFRRPEIVTTLETYVRDILTEFKDDPRIALWDLYNEPGNSGYGGKSLPLVKKVFAWARTINPSQPLTAGVFAFGKNYDALNAFHTTHSDVLSYHSYGNLAEHKKRVAWIRAQSGAERPVVCTEYMQRAEHSGFQAIMPWQKETNIGAINWGLVAGRTQTNIPWNWHPKDKNNPEPPHWSFDLLRKDGTPYVKEEGDIIRKLCN
jgi:nitroreductase